MMTNQNEELKKTSAEWHEMDKDEIIIADPDGWDRSNYHYSFYEELITYDTYIERLMDSTVYIRNSIMETLEHGEIQGQSRDSMVHSVSPCNSCPNMGCPQKKRSN